MKNHKVFYWAISAVLVSLVRSEDGIVYEPCRFEVSSDDEKLVCQIHPEILATQQLENHFLAAFEYGIPSKMFSRNLITNVSIFGSSFSGFEHNIFRGFTDMKELKIQRSMIKEIPENLLTDTKGLVLFLISGSNIHELHAQTFKGLNQLTSLEISRNPYLNGIPKDLFHDLTNIKTLALYNQNLATLETETFSTLHNLEILKLSNNFLNSLPAGIFTGTTMLKNLDLNHNHLPEINEEWFATTKFIERINLSNNKIADIPENAFRKLEMLKSLNLMVNQITTVSENLFGDLTSINNLALSNNKIAELPSKVFENTTNLQHLTLNRNKLTHIPSDLLKGLSNLDYLLLDSNQIEDIGKDVFRDCIALKTLKLNSNNIKKIDSTFIGGMVNLEVLYLDHNSISLLEEGCFSLHGCRLKKIFLNNNKLGVLPAGAFYELQQLKIVKLNNNVLNDIIPTVFPLAPLDSVDLKSNLLTMSVKDIIENIPNVKTVSLDKENYYREDVVYTIGNRTFNVHNGVWTNVE